MATASIDLRDGTTIKIDGTPEEIARVLELYGGHSRPLIDAPAPVPIPTRRRVTERESPQRARNGAMQHIRELIGEGFFSERRSIAEVQAKLEEFGRIYPQTHLSTPLRRLVMKKELRRLREGKNWAYVDA